MFSLETVSSPRCGDMWTLSPPHHRPLLIHTDSIQLAKSKAQTDSQFCTSLALCFPLLFTFDSPVSGARFPVPRIWNTRFSLGLVVPLADRALKEAQANKLHLSREFLQLELIRSIVRTSSPLFHPSAPHCVAEQISHLFLSCALVYLSQANNTKIYYGEKIPSVLFELPPFLQVRNSWRDIFGCTFVASP